MTYQTLQTIAAQYANSTIFSNATPAKRAFRLTENDRAETLAFLAIRPVHTVVMTSFINDNGVESKLNRGNFYGYRDRDGKLEGVALIGHTTLIEARSTDSLKAFAVIARNPETPIHVIMSSGRAAETFWNLYSNGTRLPRLTCTELLFELNFPLLVQKCKWNIRTARSEELLVIAEAQGEVVFIESGVNPMISDREGFLERVARRIDQARIFVVFENGKLLFKADIIAETTDAIYLEGIYVAEEYRGQGIGSSCLANLSLSLLDRVEHISLLSNVDFDGAHRSFAKAGYKNTDQCTTLFV